MGCHRLLSTRKSEVISWSRLGVSGWHGPGCSPDYTWQAIAEQDAGGESGEDWCRGGRWGETRRMEKPVGEGHRGPL